MEYSKVYKGGIEVASELTPLDQIKECVKARINFLLSGGAGCGKTHTLKETLEYIFTDSVLKQNSVACITFTNVAADEIKSRIQNPKLYVGTIHEFLWFCIKQYQKDLKSSLIELIEKEKEEEKTGIKYKGEENLTVDYFADKRIEYRQYKKLEEGIVSHNDVLRLANFMFGKYPFLCRIIKDKFPFIFIDEYQDTDKRVVEIFLEHLSVDVDKSGNKTTKKVIVGMFGDAMQSIYAYGVGNINSYVESGVVEEIPKIDNYRCSTTVIDLLNKLRFDDIKQTASGDNKNIIGSAKFLYSKTDLALSAVKKHEALVSWNFEDSENTKELYLTHRLIAGKAGYSLIFAEYGNADRLLGDNKDGLTKHLFSINELIDLYASKNYNEFIRKCNFRINRLDDKRVLKANIENLLNVQKEKTIGELIILSDDLDIYPRGDSLKEFISENESLYLKICQIPASEAKVLYDYERDYLPYSTQHNIKGTEFRNVLVVLDNGGWNQYNFGDLFGERPDKRSIIERTGKIFYVCCSRTIENLVVFFPEPSETVLNKARDWFGRENVLTVS